MLVTEAPVEPVMADPRLHEVITELEALHSARDPDIGQVPAESSMEDRLAALNSFVLATQPSAETAKEKLFRTSSAPSHLPAPSLKLGPSLASSGLDWSGSIEGPTLLDARPTPGEDGFPNRSLLYSGNDAYRNSPKRPLSRVSEDAGSGSGALSPPFQSHHVAEELERATLGNVAQEEGSADTSRESPFEAREFQEDPIERPPPDVPYADMVETSFTEPPAALNSMLSPARSRSGAEQDSDPGPLPVLPSPQPQSLGQRGKGMKSLSCLEAEGIPMLPSMQGVDVSSNSSDEIKLISELRQKLAEGMHLKARPAQQTAQGAPTRTQSLSASQTMRHMVKTVEEERKAAGPTTRDEDSVGEDDLAGASSLQADVRTFIPIESGRVTRAPSLFDVTAALQEPVEDDEWLINFSEIELGRVIGRGAFGEVVRGMWRHTDVAVKRFYDVSESLLEDFKQEVALMRRIRHSNIVQFLGAVSEYPNLSIVTSFMPRGSLYNLLHKAKVQLDDRQRLWMALDVARGMNFLHCCRPPIVHCDLKSPNLLVDRDFTIKVCDFGLSRQRRKTMLSARGPGAIGTAEWTAPEVLRGLPFNEQSDSYSYGVVLFELYTQTPPWPDLSSVQVVGAVGWGNLSLEVPENIDTRMQALMQACLQKEPHNRPSFNDIICSLRSMRSLKV